MCNCVLFHAPLVHFCLPPSVRCAILAPARCPSFCWLRRRQRVAGLLCAYPWLRFADNVCRRHRTCRSWLAPGVSLHAALSKPTRHHHFGLGSQRMVHDWFALDDTGHYKHAYAPRAATYLKRLRLEAALQCAAGLAPRTDDTNNARRRASRSWYWRHRDAAVVTMVAITFCSQLSGDLSVRDAGPDGLQPIPFTYAVADVHLVLPTHSPRYTAAHTTRTHLLHTYAHNYRFIAAATPAKHRHALDMPAADAVLPYSLHRLDLTLFHHFTIAAARRVGARAPSPPQAVPPPCLALLPLRAFATAPHTDTAPCLPRVPANRRARSAFHCPPAYWDAYATGTLYMPLTTFFPLFITTRRHALARCRLSGANAVTFWNKDLPISFC